jgi:serine/threonine protein kinase
MVYCLNYQCQKPQNPNDGKFCLHCGKPLLLGDRYSGLSLIQQGIKGRTLLGINWGTKPASYCVIKQAIVTDSVIPEEFLEIFRRNLQQLQKLGDRPEFPKVLAYFLPKNLNDLSVLPTIVFEKIEGESLLQRMNQMPTFTEKDAKAFMRQILLLLRTIHDYQLIHRDISPANLILTPKNDWAIVDFSAAKITSKAASARPGTLIGSGVYTAPEQLQGKSYPASDLYSLGVICLELLTRMHPFELYDPSESRWVWRDYLLQPVSDEFADLLDSLVADRVSDRPVNAKEALHKLDGAAYQTAIPSLKITKTTAPQESTIPNMSVAKQIVPQAIASPPPAKETWYCFKTFKGHSGYVSDLCFNESGKFLASSSADQTVRIWDVEHRWEAKCLRGHRGIVSSVLFAGETVISGSWDYTVRLWDWQKGVEGDRLEERQSWIQSLALLDDNHRLATLGADQHIALWDLKTKTFLKSWHSDGSMMIHSDGLSPVVVSANELEIFLWQNDRVLLTFSGHFDKINALKISPDSKFMLSAGADNSLILWSVLKHQADQIYRTDHPIQAIAIFPDKRFFALGDDQGALYIWQLGQDQPKFKLTEHQGAIQAIAISPDSQIIATGSADKTIKLWRFGIQ